MTRAQDKSMEKKKGEVFRMESTITLDTAGADVKDEYNPFTHRQVTHPTSTLGSFFHLLKSSLGTGLLSMPAAFKHTGLIPGCIGTFIVAVIATHCVHILVKTSRDICKECRVGSLSYTDTCVKVVKHGPTRLRSYTEFVRHFVDYAMAGVCLGGTSVYVIFIASSLKDIFDYFFHEHIYSVEIYCAILLVPLILFTQVRHLKFLVPFSLVANLCMVFTFIVTCYYTFVDIPDWSNVTLATSVQEWPSFISTAIFAMEGINVVMPVENEMAKPQHFLGCPGVLNITMGFVATLYAIVGLFGYLKYGEAVQGSVTLNLPKDEVLALTAQFLVAIAVFFSYFLQMYAPMDILWTRLKARISLRFHSAGQIIMRTFSVLLTVILAVAVPDLKLLIQLVGAMFFSTLGLFIPVVVQTIHKWERGLGKCNYILWKNVILIFFYLLVLVSGCYSSVTALIARFTT